MYANHFSYPLRLCAVSVPHTLHLQIVYRLFNMMEAMQLVKHNSFIIYTFDVDAK